MTTILLIDLSSIAHPLWHTSASEPDPNATSTKTVERVRALASGQPHVAVCCDSGRSFRKDVSADYKANRPESDAALQHQITLAMETLREDGFPVWAVKGFEADDLIATAAKLAETSTFVSSPVSSTAEVLPCNVTVCSSDKDLLQLVGPRVTVKSLTNGNEYDTAAVLAKFGVRPDQVRDWLSLVGDTSDNIKGAKGIGAKNATALLTKYGNLEDLYTDLHTHGTNFTPALSSALREFEARMPTVRELITLRTDVPLPFDEVFRERVPADVAVFGEEEQESHSADGDAHGMTQTQPDSSIASVQAPNETNPVGRNARIAVVPVPGIANGTGLVGETQKLRTGSEPVDSHSIAVRPEVLPIAAEFERQLEPRTYGEAKQLAADLFASRLFSAYGNAPAVLSTIMAGREFGIPTAASLRAFDIIEGKQAMKADFIRAIVLKSGKAEYFRCTERTADKATFITKRHGEPEMALTFTIAEGKQAWAKGDKAWDASGWGKNPADMLVARAGAKLARLVYPDVTHGLYSAEELD